MWSEYRLLFRPSVPSSPTQWSMKLPNYVANKALQVSSIFVVISVTVGKMAWYTFGGKNKTLDSCWDTVLMVMPQFWCLFEPLM